MRLHGAYWANLRKIGDGPRGWSISGRMEPVSNAPLLFCYRAWNVDGIVQMWVLFRGTGFWPSPHHECYEPVDTGLRKETE